jgi:integrase
MASIQKRGSTYRARVIKREHPTYSKTFSTRVEAVKWARGIEAQIDNGTLLPKEKSEPSFRNMSTLFKVATEEYIRTHTVHKRNCKSETFIINRLANDWGHLPIKEVGKERVLELRDSLVSANRAGATINKYYNAISKIFQMVQDEWSLNINNPVKGIKRMQANPSRIKRISGSTLQILMQSAEEVAPSLFTQILKIALETGMRRSELMGLEWQDIDLENRRVHLHVTKNSMPRRIPLTQAAVAIFKSIPKTHPDKIFPVGLCWLRRYFEKTRTRAKQNWTDNGINPFEDLRYHDLRHEALSRLSDSGLNVIELAHISGHRVLSMLQVYTHPSHEAIFAKLDKAIFN